MSFGKMPLANGFLEKKDFKNEFFYKMEIGWSERLSLLQLNNFPSPKKMFNKKYPFFTSSSEYMIQHFRNYAQWVKKKFSNRNINLIEIGSNDGTMLSNFKRYGDNYIGFEPSENVAAKALKNKINTINSFFNKETLSIVKNFKNNTDLICGANVICHIPNLINLIAAIDQTLKSKGLFIFEEPYLGSVFEKVSYDQIYDEHIYIFSATSVKKIFNLFGFELIDAVPQITHGGSMRYVVARKNNFQITKRVIKILDKEKSSNIDNFHACKIFKKNCEDSKNNLVTKLLKLKQNKKIICGYGASSKSTTVLNYCNIGTNIIDCIYDTTIEKINKYSPGMHIPIKSMSLLKNNNPDILYLFAWNHKKEIFKKEKNFLKKGGKWISHVKI
jgi:methylation protein EvaC